MKIKTLILFVVLALFLCSCGSDNGTTEPVNTQPPETIAETTVEITVATESLDMIYEKDTTINQYLNYYNKANPDTPIEAGTFEVYHHHGQDHEDQIIFTKDDYEIVISSTGWGDGIKIVIDGCKEKTYDNYKDIFIKYARAYSNELTAEILEGYWQQLLDDITNDVDFDEFNAYFNAFDGKIEYLVIEGKLVG